MIPAFLSLLILLYTCHAKTSQPPNIVFILVDDLGFSDPSSKGGQYPTPHIDELLGNSLQLDRHYIHLLCSPSRTQFLTGRYAMSFGFGSLNPWDATDIGGIPIGQPTIANWLSEFGDYQTYAVGKWHVGYATELQTPTGGKGFHHFYGFYQGAIDYITKQYDDIEDGDSGIYDFWEDGEPVYEIMSSDQNTMEIYGDKIEEYLDYEGKHKSRPFYMYAALQSMHLPYPIIEENVEQCQSMVDSQDYAIPSKFIDRKRYEYRTFAVKYCSLLVLLDDTVGRIMHKLKQYPNMYDNTLVVLTADNGGEIVYGGSNFPLRGTKGEMFDGNIRVLTALSGGVVERMGLVGQRRTHLMSNLDWTPTLLHFAGYLDQIDAADVTWQGVDQYDMIAWNKKIRTHLVLNIGDTALTSASVLVEDEENYGKLYKYMISNEDLVTDRWAYSSSTRRVDSWSVRDRETGQRGFKMAMGSSLSEIVNHQYLFDLSSDEGEVFNLLNHHAPDYSFGVAKRVIEKCNQVLAEYLEQDVFFSMVIHGLHDRLEVGNPLLIDDGNFIRPFLSKDGYLEVIKDILKKDYGNTGNEHSEEQMDIYLNEWQCPQREQGGNGPNGKIASQYHVATVDSLALNNNMYLGFDMRGWYAVVGVFIVVLCFGFASCCRNQMKQHMQYQELE